MNGGGGPLLAVILAGGFGTRMRPLTLRTPKPMLELVDRPFAAYQLEHLAAGGVTDVIFSCGYKADALRAGLSDAASVGLRSVTFEEEDRPLDTAGAARFATRGLPADRPGPILVCNGDVLTDLDVPALVGFHRRHGGRATIALTRVSDPSRYGLVRTDADGRVAAFLEKPAPETLTDAERAAPWINAGTYVLDRDVLDALPLGEPVSIERSVFPGLVGSLFAWRSDAYWLDMGTLATYVQAVADVLERRVATRAGDRVGGGVFVEASATVDPGAHLDGPLYVGVGAVVAEGARIVGPATVGRGARVEAGARVERSIVGAGAVVAGTVLDSVVGRGATVAARATLADHSAVGPGATLLGDNLIARGTRVNVDVTIPEGAIQ